MNPKPVLVTAALIKSGNKILIAQRNPDAKNQPNKWEMPGGKVELGEDPKDTIVREIKEELDMDVSVVSLFDAFSHVYERPDGVLHVVVLAYICTSNSETFNLIDAQDAKWVTMSDLSQFEYVPGDPEVINKFFEEVAVSESM
jgi:8-oxo-dGTP diphosphatase